MNKSIKWIDQYDNEKYIEERDSYIYAKGGDGTLIRAIHQHSDKNKPFFGSAKGTVNFLMNSEEGITSNVTYQKFHLIDVKVTYTDYITNGYRRDRHTIVKTFHAFNDVVLGEFNAWIEFDCHHEDNILGKFKGSGIIFSTAQGSTGINMNNHGTILPLSSKNWSVTGMQCNKNVNYVLESTNIKIDCNSRGNITCCIDGSHQIIHNVQSIELTRGKVVEVLFNDIRKFKEKRQQR